MIDSQDKCQYKFDMVYLRLMKGIVVFDLINRKIDWYWIVSVNGPIEEGVRRCMESFNGYSLSDIITIPATENCPIPVDEDTPNLFM